MSPFSTAVVRSRLVNIAADCSQMKNDGKISCDRDSEFPYPFCYSQCYGSGSGIRCLFDSGIRDE
jgi:hypothetical protein